MFKSELNKREGEKGPSPLLERSTGRTEQSPPGGPGRAVQAGHGRVLIKSFQKAPWALCTSCWTI